MMKTSINPEEKQLNQLNIMGLHRSTVRILTNDSLVRRVREAVSRNYSKKYVMEHYKLTRNQLEHILKMNITQPPYNGGMNINH